MNNQTQWTEADFERTAWHDCNIHAIALDQDGEWQSDLLLHLDFIVEWLCGADKRFRFRVAPAVLRFANVDNLRLDISLTFKQPLKITPWENADHPLRELPLAHQNAEQSVFKKRELD